jgi:hypothetical protein
MTKGRATTPEQAKAKAFMKKYLKKNKHILLTDITRETGVSLPSLMKWLSGETNNTYAHWEAIHKWMRTHDHD